MGFESGVFALGVICWLMAGRLGHLNKGAGTVLQLLTVPGSFIFGAAFIYSFWVFEWWVPVGSFIATSILAYLFLNRIQDRGMGVVVGTILSVNSFLILGMTLIPTINF